MGKIKKSVLLLTALILLTIFAAGGTIAYITAQSPALENKFMPGEVTCAVEETFTGTAKTSIKVKNTGNTEAFIRVALVGSWRDSNGNLVASWDGTIAITADWEKSGSYYYCRNVVSAGASTPELLSAAISGNVLPNGVPSGSRLVIDVLAQAIQSAPIDAVSDAWGIIPGN